MTPEDRTQTTLFHYETMRELDMAERYKPAGNYRHGETVTGEFAYYEHASAPGPMRALEQLAEDTFCEALKTDCPDVDLVAGLNVRVLKPYLVRSQHGVPMDPKTKKHDPKSKSTGKFQQWAVDYIVTGDMFIES